MSKKHRRNRKSNPLYTIIFILSILLIIIGIWLWMRQKSAPSKVESVPLAHIDHAEWCAANDDIPEQLLHRTGYIVSYNHQWKQPNWVSYELLESELNGNAKRNDRFITDKEVKGTPVKTQDYTRSGYDRGHMAPAADLKWSEHSIKESFLLSNICPQTPELNRGRWKELEELIREWVIQDSALLIACGPIITDNPQTIGHNQVAVPTRFFKAVVALYHGEPRGIGFIFENNNKRQPSLYALAVPIDSIEQASDIDLFYNLPDNIENQVESNLSIVLRKL